jgi:hypothetical protein
MAQPIERQTDAAPATSSATSAGSSVPAAA